MKKNEPRATPTENLRIEATKDFGLSIPGELNLSLSRDREELFLRLTYPQGDSVTHTINQCANKCR